MNEEKYNEGLQNPDNNVPLNLNKVPNAATAQTDELLLGKFSPKFHVFNYMKGRIDKPAKENNKDLQTVQESVSEQLFPGIDEISLIYDLNQSRIYSQLYFKYVNIAVGGSVQENMAKSQYQNENSQYQTKTNTDGVDGNGQNCEALGYFALQDHYLYRLTNFDECKVIDIFNIEFCESPSLNVESSVPFQSQVLNNTFKISKEDGKYAIHFQTIEKDDFIAWQQAFYCYIVGTGIHSFYQLEDLLGQGSFGIVYLARPCNENVRALVNLPPQAKVAIKQINKHKIRSSGQGLQAIVNEIKVHWSLNKCENILKLYQIFESPSNIYLILEFQRQGSLLGTLQAQKQLTEVQIRNIMMQLLLALDFIHQKHIIHRDIKIDNILINQVDKNDEYDVRIADFGLAVFTPKDETINQKCGTPGYVAPEILRSGGSGYSYKCDIFSLGSVFFNLLTGRYLFGGNSRNEVLRHNEKCDLSSKKKYVVNVSENGQSLLFQMLNSDPTQRPTARDVLNHPWFSDERVLLNNLIYLNDFLSNAKGGSVNQQVGSLLHASVSSMNLVNQDGSNSRYGGRSYSKNNYDSFKVASNFFVRLRKDGDSNELKDSKTRQPIDDGNLSLRMMASRNNGLNISRIASNGIPSVLGPDSGPNLAGLGGALIDEMRLEKGHLNNTGLLQRNKASNMDLPRPKTSNRSVSPFNASVSYYNAIHTYKNNKIRAAESLIFQKDDNQQRFGINLKRSDIHKSQTPDDNLPKKSKFQKKRVVEQQSIFKKNGNNEADSFDSVSKKSSAKNMRQPPATPYLGDGGNNGQPTNKVSSGNQQNNEGMQINNQAMGKEIVQKRSTKRLQPMQGHHDDHSRGKADGQSKNSKKSLRGSRMKEQIQGVFEETKQVNRISSNVVNNGVKSSQSDYDVYNFPQNAIKVSQQHKDSTFKNIDQQQKAAAAAIKQEEKQINILKVPAMGMEKPGQQPNGIMEESKRVQLYKKKSSSLDIDMYIPAEEDEGYAYASDYNLTEQRECLGKMYTTIKGQGGMAERNKPVPHGRRFIGN